MKSIVWKTTINIDHADVDEPWRERMMEWTAAHGLDPDDIPIHSSIVINTWTRTVTAECMVRNDEHRPIADEHDPLRIKTQKVTVPWTGVKPPAWTTKTVRLGNVR